jgi:broad specificity phosphatase PhoE
LSSHLREVCFGVREGFPQHFTAEEARAAKAEALGISLAEADTAAESDEQVLSRHHRFLREVVDALRAEAQQAEVAPPIPLRLFCMSHGRFIKHFLRDVCGLPAASPMNKKIGNCAVSVVRLQFDETHGHYQCSAEEQTVNIGLDDVRVLP